MSSTPEDELRQILTDIYERLATEDTSIGLDYFLDDTEYPGRLRQYAAKERLDEARHWDEHIIGAPRKVTVNDAARERIKQLKEGM